MSNDKIPTIETYRGVDLHDQQDEGRLAIVRAEIDAVFGLQDEVRSLLAWAEDRKHAPESRLLAGALIAAHGEDAAARRRAVAVDLDYVAAVTAGLDSQAYRDPFAFDTLLAVRSSPGSSSNEPVRRPVRLTA